MEKTMDYRICDATLEMVPSIADLEEEIFSDPWSEYTFAYHLPDENHEFLVAVDEMDRVVGYVILEIVLDTGDIGNIAVSEQCRQQGLADRLMTECLQRAQSRGLNKVYLEVRPSNEPAMKLYRKHGFEIVGRRKNYYEKPREDAILMTLFLKENEETQ